MSESGEEPAIAAPPVERTSSGDLRRVGFEIEFANVSVLDAADLVVRVFGGDRDIESAHRVNVTGAANGDFVIELDAAIVHKNGDAQGDDDKDDLEAKSREVLGKAIAGPVPTEIVFPPIPWTDIDTLDPLIEMLRDAGAEGTRDAVYYGFGVHINPEVAERSAEYALRHLRAYLILEEWLREEIGIDPMRRVLPHIDPFPREYALKLMDPSYEPDAEQLITDYLSANPTRSRGFDMTPLFRHLDEETLVANIDDASLIKARPTFHYRLPNADLHDPDWSFATDWNRWVEVERLAMDDGRLSAAMAEFRAWLSKPTISRWLDRLKDWAGDS